MSRLTYKLLVYMGLSVGVIFYFGAPWPVRVGFAFMLVLAVLIFVIQWYGSDLHD